jgi:D-inositol-3-phosphate glycosyltransferase
MRIAMVSEHASPLAVLGGEDAGGQNVHVAALSSALGRRGHEVTVYTRRDDPDLPERQGFAPGVEVVHVPAGPARAVPKDDLLPYMPDMALWLRREWRRDRRPDLVHAHFWMSALATRDALLTEDDAPPTAVTFHALGVVKRRHQGASDTSPPQRLTIERRLVRDLDAVLATCRDEVAELLDMGADPCRLHVVPCGVDLDRFTPTGRHRTPWTPGSIRLLCIGRLVERKGVQTAIESLRLLPDAELVVAGGPPAGQDDPDVRRLRDHARRLGVADRVHLVGGVSQDDAAALMRAADVVVSVPWYEPFGIVPLEAMACGTPVVASAVGGMLDTVEPGVTGEHVPARDAVAVAEAVRRTVARPDRLRELARAGVERVRRRFTWERVAAETEAVYARLLPSPIDVREPALSRPRAAARTSHEEAS